MRTVKDIIDTKGIMNNVIEPGTLVIDALHKLIEVNLSYLVVKDESGFKGLFSERDYTRNVVLKGRTSVTATVGEVMSVDLPKVNVYDSAEDCMNILSTHRARYLVAYDDSDFVGVITIHDLLRLVISNKEGVFDHTLAEQLLEHDENGKVY